MVMANQTSSFGTITTFTFIMLHGESPEIQHIQPRKSTSQVQMLELMEKREIIAFVSAISWEGPISPFWAVRCSFLNFRIHLITSLDFI